MEIKFDKKSNKFVISCHPNENAKIVGIPERRFRPASRTWAVPALRRNIEWMRSNLWDQSSYTPEAWAVLTFGMDEEKADIPWPDTYKFKNEPLPYQMRGLKKWFPLDSAAILYKQGLGKTFTSINLASLWRHTEQIDAVVVLCPSSVKLVWPEELKKHCPLEYQVMALESGQYKRAEKFIADKTGFKWLIVGIEGLSQGHAIDYIKSFMIGRKVCIICDESSTIKTPGTERTTKAIELGGLVRKSMILTGTSITTGVENFFTQYKFLDPNILGFNNYFTFRANFCITISMVVGVDNFGRDRTVQKVVGYKNEDELIKLISPYTERVEKEDAGLGLPPKIFQSRILKMNPTQKKLYDTMYREFLVTGEDLGNLEYSDDDDDIRYAAKSHLEQTLRLQQITGGHYPVQEGDEKVRMEVIPGVNPKIKELISILDEVDSKVIVWCMFRSEVELIKQHLEKSDYSYVEFHGGCDDDQKRQAVDDFQNGTPRVMVATRAAAYGLTLHAASYAIYYSQPCSLDVDEQSSDRIHRIGQKYPCTYIYLLMEKSIDITIRKTIESKGTLANCIYSLLRNEQNDL